jgi:hypothetical protein
VLLLVLGLAACNIISSKQPDTIAGKDRVTLNINGAELAVEIADTMDKKMTGLMNRKTLPENSGMLFVYPVELHLDFWMKNTYVPLSIAFIDKTGVITEIVDMKPLDLSIIRSTKPAMYAIEVNQGWFFKHNISPGTKIIGI